MNEPYRNRIEVLQGTLDMLIVQTLQWGEQHGYGIIQAIQANSNDIVNIETGSPYPALHRLEKKGWLKSEWKHTESKQRAKYYRLTIAGKKQLLSEQERWWQMMKAITANRRDFTPLLISQNGHNRAQRQGT